VVAPFKNQENDEIIVITAYYPDKEKWSDDYKTRIKNEMYDL